MKGGFLFFKNYHIVCAQLSVNRMRGVPQKNGVVGVW